MFLKKGKEEAARGMREALEDVASSKMAEHVCEARAEDWWCDYPPIGSTN